MCHLNEELNENENTKQNEDPNRQTKQNEKQHGGQGRQPTQNETQHGGLSHQAKQNDKQIPLRWRAKQCLGELPTVVLNKKWSPTKNEKHKRSRLGAN